MQSTINIDLKSTALTLWLGPPDFRTNKYMLLFEV